MGSLEGFTEQLRPQDMVLPNTPLPVPEEFLDSDAPACDTLPPDERH